LNNPYEIENRILTKHIRHALDKSKQKTYEDYPPLDAGDAFELLGACGLFIQEIGALKGIIKEKEDIITICSTPNNTQHEYADLSVSYHGSSCICEAGDEVSFAGEICVVIRVTPNGLDLWCGNGKPELYYYVPSGDCVLIKKPRPVSISKLNN